MAAIVSLMPSTSEHQHPKTHFQKHKPASTTTTATTKKKKKKKKKKKEEKE